MIIKQIYSDNAFQNFTYLIGCPESKEALIVDPLDANKCLQVADSNGFVIKHILNTHEHMDHTAGNEDIRKTTGAKVIAFVDLMNIIDNIDRGVSDGDIINVGNSVKLEALYTPGHTMSHICLLSRSDNPALFSGDALFNAGAGNCYNGGDPETLYRTFNECFLKLPNETRVYPGHDYFANNLRFTLDIEPDNGRAKEMLDKVKVSDNLLEVVVRSCISLKVDGHRPEIATITAAKTLASFENRLKVTPRDILKVAEMAIGVRTRRGGFEEPAIPEEVNSVFQANMKKMGLEISDQVH